MTTNTARSIRARERYWRQRVAKEVDEMARSNDTVSTASPKAGWVLIVRRQVIADGVVYPVGSLIAPDKVRNLQACLDSRQLVWGPRPKHPAKSRPLPPAEKPRVLPTRPQVVESADPLESWVLTKQAAVRIFDGEVSRAVDWLLSFPELRALYLLATKVGCEREAKRRGRSVTPNEAGMVG
jgi:hypothetical protein